MKLTEKEMETLTSFESALQIVSDNLDTLTVMLDKRLPDDEDDGDNERYCLAEDLGFLEYGLGDVRIKFEEIQRKFTLTANNSKIGV